MRGTQSTHPVVPLLEQLCAEHDELLALLDTTSPSDGTDFAEEMCSLASSHLREESRALATMSRLIDPQLVGRFEDEHARIRELSDHATRRRDV
jgi:hypothetical protein